jgi:hypothetical protein
VPNIGVANSRSNGGANTASMDVSEQEKAIIIAAVQAHRQAKGL